MEKHALGNQLHVLEDTDMGRRVRSVFFRETVACCIYADVHSITTLRHFQEKALEKIVANPRAAEAIGKSRAHPLGRGYRCSTIISWCSVLSGSVCVCVRGCAGARVPAAFRCQLYATAASRIRFPAQQ